MTAPAPTIREYRVDARSTDVFGRVLVSARDHHFIVDGPVQNGCPGEELTPPELFLSAVASCGVELVHVIARDQGAVVENVKLTVHGVVDRGRQKRPDVTVFNSLRLDFVVEGTDSATAAQLVEGFKRR
ncbi:MAG: OsmC family protein [Propylenella sp.]